MEVIPAIDLLGGRCVRLYQGDYAQAETFGDDPLAMARRWQAAGARRLHLVDLDGAKAGQPVNHGVIAAIAADLNIPVQVGGGLRDRDSAARMLDLGVGRVILGTAAVKNPALVEQLSTEFPGQIVVGIDARDGWVATEGWLETSGVAATELGQAMADRGAAAIVYTDISRDGTLAGPNLESLREMAEAVSIPVIASGGVSSIADLLALLALEPAGVTGAITGKAIYTGAIDLAEAVKAVDAGRWQDVPTEIPHLA